MFGPPEGYYRTLLVEELTQSGASTWLAMHPDLPGCNAAAALQSDALAGLDAARDAWIATADQHGHAVPASMEDPLVQIVYAAKPMAYFDGEKGSATRLQYKKIEVAAA